MVKGRCRVYDRIESREFGLGLLCHTYSESPSFKMNLLPSITSYEVLGGRFRPFRSEADSEPLTILAETAILLEVLLHNKSEVTRTKFFCQSSVAEVLAGTVIKRPASAPSTLEGEESLFVLVFEGRIVDISAPDQGVDEEGGLGGH